MACVTCHWSPKWPCRDRLPYTSFDYIWFHLVPVGCTWTWPQLDSHGQLCCSLGIACFFLASFVFHLISCGSNRFHQFAFDVTRFYLGSLGSNWCCCGFISIYVNTIRPAWPQVFTWYHLFSVGFSWFRLICLASFGFMWFHLLSC